MFFLLIYTPLYPFLFFFFFNDTATTEIYTLSLHDALPISSPESKPPLSVMPRWARSALRSPSPEQGACADRKSTRLNSSHSQISYAVFCLKKKKKSENTMTLYITAIDRRLECRGR